MITDVEIEQIWVDGPDVITWYELHTNVAEPAPTANWSRVEDGRGRRHAGDLRRPPGHLFMKPCG